MLAVNCQIAATPLTAMPTPQQIVATRFFAIFSLDVIRRTRESLMWLCFLMAIDAFLPCGRADAQVPSSPEAAIKAYLSIPVSRWRERLPYVSDSDEAKVHMAQQYAASDDTPVAENVVVEAMREAEPFSKVGDTRPLRVSATWGVAPESGAPKACLFYVTRDRDGYRVNWMRTCRPWLERGTPEMVAYSALVGPQSFERLAPLVANIDVVRPLMEKFYSRPDVKTMTGFSEGEIESVTVSAEDDIFSDGKPFQVYVTPRGVTVSYPVWIVKTADGYKVDWVRTFSDSIAGNGRPGVQDKAPRRVAPKQAEVVIDSTRKMIAFDEDNPTDYVGTILRVEPTVGWIDPITFRRDRSLKGYIFRWSCGENFEGAEEFGGAGLRREGLNYVADTELGLSILDKLQKGSSYRIGMTFAIEEQVVDGRPILVARLQGIAPGKNSARDRARAQAEIDEIFRGR